MMNDFYNRFSNLCCCKDSIENALKELIKCFETGQKLLICGNGGSCSDCEHIAGELMKGFLKKRPLTNKDKKDMKLNYPCIEDSTLNELQKGLPVISLPSFTGINSAFCNDVNAELMYAQTLMALAKKEDILLAISTSGNSKNVVAAAKVARATGCVVIALTGSTGGKLKDISNICICVHESETFKIQELHLPIYHYLCAKVEEHFFDE